MNLKIPAAILFLLASIIAYRVSLGSEKEVLGESVDALPVVMVTILLSPTPVATMSATETITPVASITATPTIETTPEASPTSQPQREFTSEQIYHLMDRFGAEYGVDPNVLRYIAICESGFRPEAENLYYAGLFQFDKVTWAKYRQLMDLNDDPELRFDAEEAIKTASYALSLKQSRLWPNCYPE